MAALIIQYWPAVVAGLYLAYVLAAGNTAQVAPALTAFIAALGLGHQAQAAHAKIDSFIFDDK
jgi:hypothetical protein